MAEFKKLEIGVALLVGLVVLSGCDLFRPNYYEGTCVTAEGKQITRYVYPVATWDTSSTTRACDDRQIAVKTDK